VGKRRPSGPEQEWPSLRSFEWRWSLNDHIRPCRYCTAWRAQVIRDAPGDPLWIREWHAVDCAVWAESDGLNT